MSAKKLLVVLVCVLTVGALLPATAGAAFNNSKATSADAWWSSWDWSSGEPGPADATTDWWANGIIVSGVFKDGGVPLSVFKDTSGGAGMMSFTPASDGEPATWTEFSVIGSAPDVALSFGKQLSSAKLELLAEGTTNVWYDEEPWVEVEPDMWELREPDSTTSQIVSLVATWKATGPLSKSNFMTRDRTDGILWADRTQANSRPARADVSIVGADATEYFVGTMTEGNIGSYKSVSRFPAMPMEP